MMPSTELAWAAGLFDGEGSLFYSIHSKTQRRPKGIKNIGLSVGQSGDPAVLVRFKCAVGCGYLNGPYEKSSKRTHRKPVYRFNAWSFEEIQWIVIRLWPYLSRPKRKQAQNTLRTYITDTRRTIRLPRNSKRQLTLEALQ